MKDDLLAAARRAGEALAEASPCPRHMRGLNYADVLSNEGDKLTVSLRGARLSLPMTRECADAQKGDRVLITAAGTDAIVTGVIARGGAPHMTGGTLLFNTDSHTDTGAIELSDDPAKYKKLKVYFENEASATGMVEVIDPRDMREFTVATIGGDSFLQGIWVRCRLMRIVGRTIKTSVADSVVKAAYMGIGQSGGIQAYNSNNNIFIMRVEGFV